MIELLQNRLKSGRDISEIHHPACAWTGIAPQMNFNTERMAMQPGTFVPDGNIGQTVRRVKFENLINLHCITLPHSKYFMQLQTDSPPGMRQHIGQGLPQGFISARSIHGLQKEMPEVQLFIL